MAENNRTTDGYELYPGADFFKDVVGLVKIRSITYKVEIQFLPYDLKITENLTPEWNQENVIGRMDPIARFKRMGRTMNLNFKIRAKEKLDVNGQYSGPYLPYDDMLHSVDHMKKIMYPRYNSNQVMTSPPLFRIKCENLILAGEETDDYGVLCFITTLKADPTMEKNSMFYKNSNTINKDYLTKNNLNADKFQIGNLETGMYPSAFDMNIGFTVLNESLAKQQVSGILNKRYFYNFSTSTGPKGGHLPHEEESPSSTPATPDTSGESPRADASTSKALKQ